MALNTPVLTREEWERLQEAREIHNIVPETEGSDWRGLLFRPNNVTFYTQNKGERVFILMRRHIVTNTGWIFNTAVMSVIPIVLNLILRALGIRVTEMFDTQFVIVGMLVYYSILLSGAIVNLVNWYFNLFIVTNERVIDYDFKAFVSQGVSESNLAGIEDVKEESIGFLPQLFNYGDVSMYSAADKNVIVFDSVPNPSLVRDKVADLAKIAKNRTYD